MLTGFTPAVKREPQVQDPMLTGFTPPEKLAKPREPTVKREPMGPDTPWAMQTVTVQTGPAEPPRLLRVEPVHPPKERAPWVPVSQEPRSAPAVQPLPRPEHPHAPPEWDQPLQDTPKKQKRGRRPKTETHPTEKPARHVSARNYAAVEAGLERFGLIHEGLQKGSRTLLVHIRKHCRPPFLLLNAIRPGTVLYVRRRGQSDTAPLRVRSTTPARYYSPGSQVTTLSIVVDEADWQSLAGSASRI